MQGEKARKIKIKIVEDGKNKINFTLPLFIISALVFITPAKLLNKWVKKDIDIKKMYRELKSQGKGTKINIKDENEEVRLELK